MVRLKVNKNVVYIAIIVRISIPYGAIKRGIKIFTRVQYKRFQFLMVRLKELHRRRFHCQCKISIPYGAIKSVVVVIKVCVKKNFNSLWCD